MGKSKVLWYIVSFITYMPMKIIDYIFYWLYSGKGITVQAVRDPILLMPAVTIAQKIRTRELRAEDVMTAYIVRAKEVNQVVNAMTGEKFAWALRKAREVDEQLDAMTQRERDKLAQEKPFLGVPLSVKEAFAWTGMGNTSGVVERKHIISQNDAPVLANLQAAGAIPFIQTNVSEACMWFESSNYVHGCTNNAYNTSRIVGGSSGGEGCILSTGASVIGIGSDIGGSIRMPCFFNGVFGHKPSVGIVDNAGQFPIASAGVSYMLATGPLCRYAVDLIPSLKAMAGPESIKKLKLDQKVDLSKLKVITVPDDGGSLLVSEVDMELKDAQARVAEFLAKHGATVTEGRFDKFRLSLEMWAGKMNSANDGPRFSTVLSGSETGHVNCFKEFAKWFVGMTNHTLPAIALGIANDYTVDLTRKQDLKACEILEKLKEEVLEALGNDTVLLYPSHPKIAPYHNHPIFTPFNFAYTGLFNVLGLPVTQCPLGLSKDGLPLGVQVVTSPYNDHLSLAVAEHLEKGFGGWKNPGT